MNASDELGRINAQLQRELTAEPRCPKCGYCYRGMSCYELARAMQNRYLQERFESWQMHKRPMQTKRPDQVQFSAVVFFVAFAITFAVVVGAWLWRVF